MEEGIKCETVVIHFNLVRKTIPLLDWKHECLIRISFSASVIAGILVSFGSADDTFQFRQFWDPESVERNSNDFGGQAFSLMGGVLAANSAQLIITVSYYFYNSVLTSMLASAEFNSYGVDRKPLRVTWPVKGSRQRSTYWLSLPYQYNIPIMVLYMILHWLVSEGLYYVLMIPYDFDDQPIYEERISSVGNTSVPILFAIGLGSFMISILVALSFRRLKSKMPLAGSCSAAISAACHPPKDDCTDTAALGELMWGETGLPLDWDTDQSGDDHKGHCSFTSLDGLQPSSTKSYA
jgi:hypothetical protein